MAEKLDMKSMDILQENVEKIKELFPNTVTEVNKNGKISLAVDFDALKQELSDVLIEDKQERYQMTWPDKGKSKVLADSQITATLRLIQEKCVDFDTTKNLYIEGDNLDVLKLLRETYLGRIKMIYIDPPYNTGSDLLYMDNFNKEAELYLGESGQFDEEGNRLVKNIDGSGRFHTDWLNMIYPRLRVAKDLLANDGVIFISIDDNEAVNLKKICDEIFSERNFVGQITVVGNPRGRDYGGVARMHDYILVYRRSESAVLNLIKDAEGEFTMSDQFGGFELRELRNRNIKFNKGNRPNLYYPFYIDPVNEDQHGLHPISLEKKEGWIELYPLESQGVNTVWRWGKEKAKDNLNINICAKPMRNGSYMIVEKYRESKRMARSVWWDKDTNTEKGTLLVKELMEGKVFDYPKPVEMMMRMIEMGTNSDTEDIVLDFFSGSATTAHAVMEMNAEDDGNRRFIMVQYPEKCDVNSEAYKCGYKTICEIGEERIRRAGKKIQQEKGLLAQNIDIGYRVLKCDTSNMQEVYYNPHAISQTLLDSTIDNIKPDRTSEDLLFQVMLDLGVELSAKIEEKAVCGKTVFAVNGNDVIACFDENITNDIIVAIAKEQPLYAVFRDKSFATDSVGINNEQLFKTYSPATVIKVL